MHACSGLKPPDMTSNSRRFSNAANFVVSLFSIGQFPYHSRAPIGMRDSGHAGDEDANRTEQSMPPKKFFKEPRTFTGKFLDTAGQICHKAKAFSVTISTDHPVFGVFVM